MIICQEVFGWLSRLRKTYQPVPGFENKIDPERIKGFERILKTILEHCGDVKDKRFLDIGSNLGYFCFELTKRGAETVGVERDKMRVQVCKCVSKRDGFSKENPRFVNGDVKKLVATSDKKFDYVLLLNVFHHLLVQDEDEGWTMFNKLIESTDGIFVMMRNSLRDWKLCDRKADIPIAVLEKSSATSFVAYPAVHGRIIYLFR